MVDIKNIKYGKEFFPQKKITSDDSSTITGNHWTAWEESGSYFLEYDKGQFSTKLKTIEISETDFSLLKSNPDSLSDIVLKYDS